MQTRLSVLEAHMLFLNQTKMEVMLQQKDSHHFFYKLFEIVFLLNMYCKWFRISLLFIFL